MKQGNLCLESTTLPTYCCCFLLLQTFLWSLTWRMSRRKIWPCKWQLPPGKSTARCSWGSHQQCKLPSEIKPILLVLFGCQQQCCSAGFGVVFCDSRAPSWTVQTSSFLLHGESNYCISLYIKTYIWITYLMLQNQTLKSREFLDLRLSA